MSEWSNGWNNQQQPVSTEPVNPWDNKSQDEVLQYWQSLKDQLSKIKEAELDFRKYVVKRAFPNPNEGTNTLELGNGYELKAGVKFNYKLNDNQAVEKGLEEIAKIGNEGAFVADRIVSWHPSFLLTEYRQLQEDAQAGSETAVKILSIVNTFLTITDAAPSLDIKEPKGKKK